VKRVALLDVNVLVALFDPDHVHHDLAHDWFADQRADGWATCPITENGLVRVLSNPAYGPNTEPAAAIVSRFRKFCGSGGHSFWPDAVSLRDEKVFQPRMPVTTRQLTDVYLLALARHHGGALATFDHAVPLKALRGAAAHDLLVIRAS
jgi:toxin-antitoxin system PIN domain toxin